MIIESIIKDQDDNLVIKMSDAKIHNKNERDIELYLTLKLDHKIND